MFSRKPKAPGEIEVNSNMVRQSLNLNSTIAPGAIPRSRTWHGRRLSPAEEMLMFHDQKGPVPETLERLTDNLEKAGIKYVVIGSFALGEHNFSRATNDIDVCMRPADLERFRNELVGRDYQLVEGRTRRFFDTQTQVTLDILVSGELAGRTSRNKVIKFPDPAEAEPGHDLPTVSLPRLVELKLVTWRLKDWADVIALIRANRLDESFAEKLDPLVRMAYLECYDEMLEEDKYDRERE